MCDEDDRDEEADQFSALAKGDILNVEEVG